jgi:hypothetical protein
MSMPPPPPEESRTASLDVGGVFDRVFTLYRQQAGLLLPAALVIFLPVSILSGLLQTEESATLVFLVLVIGFVGGFWYQGMVVEAVRDILDGRRDFTVGGLFKAAAPFIGPLIAVGLLAGLGITAGLILCIVPGLFLLTLWAVIVPVVVLERSGVLAAFGRSAELTKENRWKVFAVVVLLALLQAAISFVLGLVAEAVSESFVLYAAANLVTSVLTAPLTSLAATVIYLELRRLREGALPGGAPAPGPAPA